MIATGLDRTDGSCENGKPCSGVFALGAPIKTPDAQTSGVPKTGRKTPILSNLNMKAPSAMMSYTPPARKVLSPGGDDE